MAYSGQRRAMADDNGVEFRGLIQSMLNVIQQPVSTKPGGYPDDIFLDLTPEEKEKYECLIWYVIKITPHARCIQIVAILLPYVYY